MRTTRYQRQQDRINYSLGVLMLILSALVAYVGVTTYGL
jgi:hypothetical protein